MMPTVSPAEFLIKVYGINVMTVNSGFSMVVFDKKDCDFGVESVEMSFFRKSLDKSHQ